MLPTTIKCFDVALLAGEISQWKTQQNGWHNLIDYGYFDIENLESSVDAMIESTDKIVSRHKAWTPLQQTRAGIVAWEYSLNDVYR